MPKASHNRYAAPSHLIAVNASAEAASRAARPSAAASVWMTHPLLIPNAAASPARTPPCSVRESVHSR